MRFLFKLLFEAGLQAVLLYRLSNWFYQIKLLRVFSYFFSRFNLWFTSADIHPAATLGERLIIPHPVGIVIGADSVIGDDCVVMHGVTLGAKGHGIRGNRHPKVGNRVKIFCNSTLLGPIEIGDDTTIGSHTLVTKSVPRGSIVIETNKVVSGRDNPEQGPVHA